MDGDYIKELNYDEKTAFISIFCKLIKADGNIDKNEVDFLKMISARYGIDNSTVVGIIKNASNINIADEAAKITSRAHALELVKELCVLTNIDGESDDDELDLIIDVARALNLEDKKVIMINRWVLDSIILNKTGDVIMERNNG